MSTTRGLNFGSALPCTAYVPGSAKSFTAQTNVDITGLNLQADIEYEVQYEITNAAGSTINLLLYLNSDTTATNYDEQQGLWTGSGTTVSRANGTYLGSVNAGGQGFGSFRIRLGQDGKARCIFELSRESTTTIALHSGTVAYRTAGNVTSIRLSTSVASALTGSIRVYTRSPRLGLNSGVNEGSTFPTDNLVHYRKWRYTGNTTLGPIDCFYDATLGKWLSDQIFTIPLRWIGSTVSVAATTAGLNRFGFPYLFGCPDAYLMTHHCRVLITSGASALSASHKWVGVFAKYDSAVAATTLATINVDSGASGTIRDFDSPISAMLGAYVYADTSWTKTGTPGALQSWEEVSYRLVVG